MQRHRGWSQPPVVIAERTVGVGWQLGDGTDTPDPALGIARGQKGRELRIAEPEGALLPRAQLRLPDQRQDGPGDQVPVLIQRNRDDRLDVQDVLRAAFLPVVEVGVVLKRDADQVRDGILRQFGQFLGTRRGESRWTQSRKRQDRRAGPDPCWGAL